MFCTILDDSLWKFYLSTNHVLRIKNSKHFLRFFMIDFTFLSTSIYIYNVMLFCIKIVFTTIKKRLTK